MDVGTRSHEESDAAVALRRAGRKSVAEGLEHAQWLLDSMPEEKAWELCDRFPLCELIWSVRWARRQMVPVTADRIRTALKCSRATAYRYLAALRALGELGPDALEREEQESRQ